jgi:hypothetical protein
MSYVIYEGETIVCRLNKALEVVSCRDATVRSLLREYKESGVPKHESKITGSVIAEFVKFVPYSVENVRLLEDDLAARGYDLVEQ